MSHINLEVSDEVRLQREVIRLREEVVRWHDRYLRAMSAVLDIYGVDTGRDSDGKVCACCVQKDAYAQSAIEPVVKTTK